MARLLTEFGGYRRCQNPNCCKVIENATYTRAHVYCSKACREECEQIFRFQAGDFSGTPATDAEEKRWNEEVWRRAGEIRRQVKVAMQALCQCPDTPEGEREFRARMASMTDHYEALKSESTYSID